MPKMDEQSRLTESAVRISHYLQGDHRINMMAGAGSGAALLRGRLESGGVNIDGAVLTLRNGSILVWAGDDADPLRERLVEITLDDA